MGSRTKRWTSMITKRYSTVRSSATRDSGTIGKNHEPTDRNVVMTATPRLRARPVVLLQRDHRRAGSDLELARPGLALAAPGAGRSIPPSRSAAATDQQ